MATEFHAVQGWYFARCEDGSVRIRHGNGPECEEVVMDPNTWASAMASVSKRGENGHSFHAALDFHMGPVEGSE